MTTNPKSYLQYLPEELAIIVWKNVYNSNVCSKIIQNSCKLCGRYMRKKYNNKCFICLITKHLCLRCMTPYTNHDPVKEMETDFSGSFLYNITQFGFDYWITQDELYGQLLCSNYTCINCLRRKSN